MERRRPRLRGWIFQRSRGRLRSTIILLFKVLTLPNAELPGQFMSSFYRRNLPHIEKDGSSYFVTFSTHKEFGLSEDARTLVFDHCLFENNRKIHLHAFVVMPDHVHMLFTPLENDKGEMYSLAEIMHGLKGASSHSVNKLVGRAGTLWEPESFDRIVRSSSDFEYRVIYIVQNPIAAGLAKGPDDYRWAWREFSQPKAVAAHNST